MPDFVKVQCSTDIKRGEKVTTIFPSFICRSTKDLMIQGHDFYAAWDEKNEVWVQDQNKVLDRIDELLWAEADIYRKKHPDDKIIVQTTMDSQYTSIDKWYKYCQKQLPDSFVPLNETLIFSNTPTSRENYSSIKLDYPLEPGTYTTWDKIVGTLYSETERHKIEWSIGAVVSGASKTIQKFVVFYGEAGSGKSTILNIVEMLFKGYTATFDAKSLGDSGKDFSLEAFKNHPLVGIQHDGDLYRIEDNTKLNSLISHEPINVNRKFKSEYTDSFKTFLFMGTNRPVKITDAKSGIIRRLIDVHPSGDKLPIDEYNRCMEQVKFELSGIAWHCQEVYLANPHAYDNYRPRQMMGATNHMYDFILESYSDFLAEDGVGLNAAWKRYKQFCEDALVDYPLRKMLFKEELKSYFREFKEDARIEDRHVTNYYFGFRTELFTDENAKNPEGENPENKSDSWLEFKSQPSIFDEMAADYTAQYASDFGTPRVAWCNVSTTLSQIDTSELHYVKTPINHIVIDFDIKDPDGKKSLERNKEAASKWPETYAELSKSGAGIHLHYIYTGDPLLLSSIYDDNIEIKVFKGDAALRRKLTLCNNKSIASISSGLPLKGEDDMVNREVVTTEKGLRTTIKRCLNKEIHPYTKGNIDFIKKILDDAYDSGISYDVSDMYGPVFAFAGQASNSSEYCMDRVDEMHFKSEVESEPENDDGEGPIVFFDCEVFPNLFLINWKFQGEDKPIYRMINPSPEEVEEFALTRNYRRIGFNCRRYDNHILYARTMGYSNIQLYNLSQRIVNSKKGDPSPLFGEAYNVSYTDIYDFASANHKKSLKKLEIDMGISHVELGLPWDEPVAEEDWDKVAEYCDYDVIATEKAFEYLSADWTARQIVADLAEMSPNSTSNSLSAKIIFQGNRNPQSEFCYRDLSQPVFELDPAVKMFLHDACPEMMATRHGPEKSLLPYFPGYKYEFGVSTYHGELKIGEGGLVYAEPGMYYNVALLDVASMHPHSVIAECLFGPEYTSRFREIVEGRVSIKHEDWDAVNSMLDGKLAPYIQKVINGEMTSKDLANALKTIINSMYGLTTASFKNPFKDERNKDNIVAKRGALFMTDLKREVQKRGYTVAHIKTDSIKIPDATPEIIQFVMDFGRLYGYTFEHEETYERMCLVNNAVYIAKYKKPHIDKKTGKEIWWTATGKQFQVPYVFKTLFSHEPIELDDLCETFSVTKGALYLDRNEGYPDVTEPEKEKEKAEKMYRDGKLSDISFEETCAKLQPEIDKGHNLVFVGRVGRLCPIQDGYNGGILYRIEGDKRYAASGSTGKQEKGRKEKHIQRWYDAEKIKLLPEKREQIDLKYYDDLVNDAIETMGKYGDVNAFLSGERPRHEPAPDFMHVPITDEEEVPYLL